MAKNSITSRIVLSLIGAVIFMFFFSFMLVPLYNVFCEITGINGKIYGPSDFFKKKEQSEEERRYLQSIKDAEKEKLKELRSGIGGLLL